MSKTTDQISEPTNKQIEASIAKGHELFEVIQALAVGYEATDDLLESSGIMFSAWIGIIHYLAEIGWTTDDLVNEVREHAGRQRAN